MVKRLLVAVVILIATTGGAHGDTFAVASAYPSASEPNQSEAVSLPPSWTSPPAQPVQLSYPELQSLWQSAGAAYGIPWQVLGAINKIESNFGNNMGPSSAGALGWMQFMPSTWIRWGVDANGDGISDPWNPQDAIFAAARYLAAAGGQSDLRRAIFAYNHADWYVNEVVQLAQQFESTASTQLPAEVQNTSIVPSAAGLTLAAASTAYQAALAKARVLAARADALERRAVNPRLLLSDRLTLQMQAAQAAVNRDFAQEAANELQAKLEQARGELTAAQSAAVPQAAPQAGQSGWVFPVGGGPGVVSASHTHHDYPAVDIAAPQGSPVFAISNSTVLRSWGNPDPRCGIGLTIRTDDGRVWTYCHLSYLEPTAQPGASLAAGELVGLVGMTGDASGPHLHLQLQPATSYPQNEGWFEAFAGTAFSWQDAPPAEGDTTPTFSIVEHSS
jgi:murein DD-endopeptidase MepM/ murein hydrolase activator NlpD